MEQRLRAGQLVTICKVLGRKGVRNTHFLGLQKRGLLPKEEDGVAQRFSQITLLPETLF